MQRPLTRIAPWILLIVAAYALGRWHRMPTPESGVEAPIGSAASAPESAATAEPVSVAATDGASAEPSRADVLRSGFARLHATARTMAVPDAATYAWFEQLGRDDLPDVVAQILALPPGNEQDLFFIMAIRRWAEMDGATALDTAQAYPAMNVRRSAVLGAWEAWGAHDAVAAAARAVALEPGRDRDQALASLLTGAATHDPHQAMELWLASPEAFRTGDLGPIALSQIVAGAYGTGKREAIQTLVASLPADATRDRLASALCSEWGGHYPDDALAWLDASLPEGEARDAARVAIFEAVLGKDPQRAAEWGAGFPDARRRGSMIAAAIGQWVEMDATEAELWINEQPDSADLDGATFAMAGHFIGAQDMPRAFAWVSRIRRDEARGEMLANLGRAWARDDPTGFKAFLDSTSLNRPELERLLSRVSVAE